MGVERRVEHRRRDPACSALFLQPQAVQRRLVLSNACWCCSVPSTRRHDAEAILRMPSSNIFHHAPQIGGLLCCHHLARQLHSPASPAVRQACGLGCAGAGDVMGVTGVGDASTWAARSGIMSLQQRHAAIRAKIGHSAGRRPRRRAQPVVGRRHVGQELASRSRCWEALFVAGTSRRDPEPASAADEVNWLPSWCPATRSGRYLSGMLGKLAAMGEVPRLCCAHPPGTNRGFGAFLISSLANCRAQRRRRVAMAITGCSRRRHGAGVREYPADRRRHNDERARRHRQCETNSSSTLLVIRIVRRGTTARDQLMALSSGRRIRTRSMDVIHA